MYVLKRYILNSITDQNELFNFARWFEHFCNDSYMHVVKNVRIITKTILTYIQKQ